MKIHCPNCGVKGSADDSYLGRKVKCPKCQGVFVAADESMAEQPGDNASFSAPAVAPEPSTPDLQEGPLSVREEEDIDESGPVAALSGEPTEEMLDFADDAAEADPPTAPVQQSALDDDTFNLDDIAAEIEMQMAAAEAAGEPEEIPDGSPVDIGSLEDEFDQPTDGETVAPEIAAVADNYIEEIEEDAAQLVEEQAAAEPEVKDIVEPAPMQNDEYATPKQCRQCGKNEGQGELFITSGDQLYCPDCAPVEVTPIEDAPVEDAPVEDAPVEEVTLVEDAPGEDAPVEDPVKPVEATTEQAKKAPDAPADTANMDDGQSSFGAALKKIWTKIKGALFS